MEPDFKPHDFKPPDVKLVYDATQITDLITNILLIHDQVGNYNEFVDGCNAFTFPIVYNYSSTKTELTEVLKNFNKINRIAVVCHGSESPLFLDVDQLFSESNTNFFIEISKNITNLDFLACNTLYYDTWNAFYDALKKDTTVIIGASDDATGNLKQGGDWIMESTKEDIVSVYFTDKIMNYQDTLNTYTSPEGVKYTYYGSNATVTGFTSSAVDIIIPSTITVDNIIYTVWKIDSNPYLKYPNSTLKTIEIPNSVTNIELCSFGQYNLTSVTFTGTSTITILSDYVFYGCSFLVSVIIPASVTSFGTSLFKNCSQLTSVTFAGTSMLTTIGDQVFQECRLLNGFVIPASVNSIGINAFYNSGLHLTFATGR
jgi:hypothetical protein